MSNPESPAPETGPGGQTRQDVTARSIGALLWGGFGTGLRMLLQFLVQIALARILGPEAFGLFALGLVVVVLSGYFADIGLAYGLIQKKDVSARDIRFVFTWQLVLGAVVATIIFLSADWAARFYDDDRLTPVLQWMSLSCFISALGSTAHSLLRRELDFKSIQIAYLSSYVVGFVVLGIPLALAGFGVWALVIAYLVQISLDALVVMMRARHPVMPCFIHAQAGGILGFGAVVFATNVLNWIMTGLDRAVVGRAMAITAAGLYATVYNFVTAPTLNAVSVLQGVFYSASAQVQDSPLRLRKGLRSMFAVVGLFLLPVFLAMAAVSHTLMLAVYGEKWSGAEIVFAPLAVAMPAFVLMAMAVPVLWASGNIRKEFALQVPIAVAWAVILLVVARTGSLFWLSWCVCLLYYARAVVIITATCRAVRLPMRLLPRYLGTGVVLAGLVAFSGWIVDQSLHGVLDNPQARLGLVILACALAMGTGLRLLRARVRPEVRSLLARLIERIPAARPRRLVGWVLGQ